MQVENLEVEELVHLNCTYLLSAKPAMPGCASRCECVEPPACTKVISAPPSRGRYSRLSAVEGFAGLDVRLAPRRALQAVLGGRLPVQVRTEPLVYLHVRRPCAEGLC